MNWAEVIAHPSLQDLPFKIELDEYGQVIMNPVKIDRSVYQGRIIARMSRYDADGGEVMAECAVRTSKGTKVADVAWATAATFARIQGMTEASIAPEVCVEVVSQSNSKREMQRKRKLYFDQGAREVWICDEYGNLSFFDARGALKQSSLFPDFPASVSYK